MDSFLEFKDAEATLAQLAEQLAEEKIPVQHVTNGVAKVLGPKGAVRFLGHLKPGTEKHTSWNNVNNALMKQGVKTHHIAKIATHIKPAQFKEESELGEEKDIVVRDKSGKVIRWSHEGDWSKSKSASGTTTDKSGAKHTPYSKARDLARSALKKTLTKEDADQIDELNKSTLASYAKKSAAELPKHQANATLKHTGPIANAHAGKHPKTGESPIQWDDRKVKNRGAGIARAVDKLSKEEVQVDEAIKGWKHAHSDIAKSRAAASDASKSVHLHVLTKAGKESGMHDARKSFSSVADAEKHHENIHKLNPGKSYKHNLYVDGKLVKTLGESVDKCNVCGQTPCNCTYINEAGQAGDPLGHLTAAERAKELARRKAKIASNTTPANKKFVDNAVKNVKPRNEETEKTGVHRVGVTVSDPNHQAVTQRKEKVQKFVRIKGGSHEEAVERAKKHFKGKGWKVHDAEHAGMVHEEVQIDEAKTPAEKMDFQRMMAGAMSRDAYNKKYKKGKYAVKSGKHRLDPTGIYHNLIKSVKEQTEIDELSNATLQSYKDKAMKSADELAAKGQHAKANDRYMKHMQASGKQISRTMQNIHKAMQQRQQNEEADLDEAVSHDSKARYEYANGHKPKGHGQWVFSTVHPREHNVEKHKDQTHAVPGNFSDAAKAAAKHFKDKGHKGDIHVLS